MKIHPHTLLEIIPPEMRPKTSYGEMFGVTQRIYCGPMTVHGLCSGLCALCAKDLQEAFTFNNASNPAAVLTQRLKHQVALIKEREGEKKAKDQVDELGLPVHENPFEAYSKLLSNS